MSDTCDVCVETYSNKSPKLSCVSCGFLSCCNCVLRYVEGSDNEPRCMQCRGVFSREFMFESMGNSMNKRLIEHNAEIAVKRQMAMLPATVPYAKLKSESAKLENSAKDLEFNAQKMLQEVRVLRENSVSLKNQMLAMTSVNSSGQVKHTIHISRCMKDICRGFVEQESGQCGLCCTTHCKMCLEIAEDGHVCCKEILANIKSVYDSCKPCPSCCAPIHKIDGCNDMFCVVCKTAFCWRTMKIHSAGNSNPLYFNWMRTNTETILSRDPMHEFQRTEFYQKIPKEIKDMIMCVSRQVRHHDAILRNLENTTSVLERGRKEMEIRAKFLTNEVDNAGFKKFIKKLQNDTEHTNMIRSNTSNNAESIANYLMSETNDWCDPETLSGLETLADKFNTSASYVGKVFKRVQHTYITVTGKV
jgi:hypothetical protein